MPKLLVLLDELADFVAVFVRHDDVGDHGIRRGLAELRERRGGVGAGDDVNILLAEGDLDHFAHGGAVVDEIDGGSARSRQSVCVSLMTAPFPGLVALALRRIRAWRRAARSVAERSTVRCAAVAP